MKGEEGISNVEQSGNEDLDKNCYLGYLCCGKWPFFLSSDFTGSHRCQEVSLHHRAQTPGPCSTAFLLHTLSSKTFKHHGQTDCRMMHTSWKWDVDYVYGSKILFENSTAFVKAYNVIKIFPIIIFLEGRNK